MLPPVTIDMASQTLGFSVNGKFQGVAYKNLPTGVPIKAAVSLYKKGSKVQLLDAFRAQKMDSHVWSKMGAGIKISGTVARKLNRNWDNGTAVVGRGVQVSPQARLKCSFRILRGTQVTLGVCTSSFDPRKDGYVNKTSRGWGYYQGDGKIGHNCSANKKYGKVLAAGDLVDGMSSRVFNAGEKIIGAHVSPYHAADDGFVWAIAESQIRFDYFALNDNPVINFKFVCDSRNPWTQSPFLGERRGPRTCLHKPPEWENAVCCSQFVQRRRRRADCACNLR